jgi:hypothetical protein
MRISRLVLHTPPLSREAARELAEGVATDLSGLALRPAGAIRLDVSSSAPLEGSAAATLRRDIVEAILRALGEDPAVRDRAAPTGEQP